MALAAIALAALTGSATIAAAPARPTVPNPTVYGPIGGGIHGYPWNHSLFRLRGGHYDYTENEYFFSGTATDLSTGAQAPYESRMLVRLPRDRSTFSGEVLVEFAFICPILFLLIFGIIDFGSVYNDLISLRQGVREGARQGSVGVFGGSTSCQLQGATGSTATTSTTSGSTGTDSAPVSRATGTTSACRLRCDNGFATTN